MAIVANTFTRYSAVGIREDLSNVIYNISPEETPFISNIGRESVKNTYFEWQTDELAAASASNAALEGDDISSYDAVTPTARVGNYTQISTKNVVISGTMEALDKAGRRSELTYQLAKMGSELKRDMESALLANQSPVAGNTTTARRTAGLPAWIKTNTDFGTGGADTAGVAARTDGTQRAFTEDMLKDVIAQVWESGGTPKMLMVGSFNKQAASGFDGIATRFRDVPAGQQAQIVGAADVYVSDFGTVNIVPNRFQRARDAFVVDPEYASMAVLRPIEQMELAKTGDAEKRLMLVEYGLKVKNEAAHGIVADLTTA
jgi:predicted pyridoxine 5'-phosphate oxidase superfamily flavin-nucleotide-binding protein